MIEKELILIDLQKQMHDAEDKNVKTAIAEIISNIVSGVYNIRVW